MKQLCVGIGVALIVTGTPACGRKGPVRPPEDVVPNTITDLSASNVTAGIQLAWNRPRLYANGAPMTDLGGFVIERAATADPHAIFTRITTLEVSDRDRFRQLKRFRHIDPDVSVGTTYQYRVVSFTLDRYFSAPSNVVMIERGAPVEEKHASLPAAQR